MDKKKVEELHSLLDEMMEKRFKEQFNNLTEIKR